MRNSLVPMLKVGALLITLAAIGFATDAFAKKPGGGGGCPRPIQCTDVYDPVICSDGVVYGNACYAYRECATGCVPYGDGGPIEAAGKAKCPRDIQCPDNYNPVICSNGVVYGNACYAYKACAVGCVAY